MAIKTERERERVWELIVSCVIGLTVKYQLTYLSGIRTEILTLSIVLARYSCCIIVVMIAYSRFFTHNTK